MKALPQKLRFACASALTVVPGAVLIYLVFYARSFETWMAATAAAAAFVGLIWLLAQVINPD
jgi:energy-converting hydrogenase Eha subunit F